MILASLANFLTSLALMYFAVSVPIQLIKRYFNISKGVSVTPWKAAVNKLLKHWLAVYVIIVIVSSMLTMYQGYQARLHPSEIINFILFQIVFGNILTALVWGMFVSG